MQTGANTIWIEGWQMECCGNPFRVDSHVVWSVRSDPDLEFLTRVLGEAAVRITGVEEHHGGGEPLELQTIDGVVRSIQAAFCQYTAQGDDPRWLSPVSGTTVLRSMAAAPRDERDRDDIRFVGYLVEVDVTTCSEPYKTA